MFKKLLCLAALVVAATSNCVADIPTTGTNAVQLSFYANPAGGKLHDTCPSSCDGTPIKQQWYAIADSTNKCYQWPGNAGENAMKSGTCGANKDSYTYDQWTNCNCSGQVGNSKTVYTTKCVVDMPTSICSKITDITACGTGSSAMALFNSIGRILVAVCPFMTMLMTLH
eukprot:NODE_7219_length_782_cov_144.918058_g6979_i0.p2 GENE.NODE_7219_length_782_cov_144.918058_g6979_i0~~NODE_7219_length_782_cov_144.918058_g6979_i0.p2  ORF type:complete len:170 (+),score=37.22 NODE_7219_length_782_cov_144.918058_g6979_i0:61-570(+)